MPEERLFSISAALSTPDVQASHLHFSYITSEVNSIMRRCFLVSLHTSDWIRFCTILQDKLYSFNNQDHRSMGFLCKTNYGIDLQRFHEENSIMSGLFSKNNLLLCGMQSNNGISAKTLKNFQNHQYSLSVLTSDKRQICSTRCR